MKKLIIMLTFFLSLIVTESRAEVKTLDIYTLGSASGSYHRSNVLIKELLEQQGVKVGEVSGISLDQENYMAIITSSIDESVKIPDNSTFKISNNGFIGSPYIEIKLGESEVLLQNNDYTTDNIDAVSLEEIINNFIFK